jgi:prepilin-type processing-associated H-X9-DG protein
MLPTAQTSHFKAMLTRKPARSRTCGYTIVEVLVTSGIVCVLAAISFAVAREVRVSALRTVDASNQKQIARAIDLYVQDSEGFYPDFGTIVFDGHKSQEPRLKEALQKYGAVDEVFYSPADVYARTTRESEFPEVTFEHSSFFFCFGETLITHEGPRPYGQHLIASPSEFILIVNKNWLVREGSGYLRKECAFGGGANFTFADGHQKHAQLPQAPRP